MSGTDRRRDLSFRQVIDEYRKMAAEARAHAVSATSAEMKAGYEHLAKSWDQLIGEIEKAIQSGKR